MTKLDAALKTLAKARRRLTTEQTPIARRNARRAFVGALRSIEHHFNSEYPRFKSIRQPQRRRPWARAYAELFLAIAHEIYGTPIPRIVVMPSAGSSIANPNRIEIDVKEGSRARWKMVRGWLDTRTEDDKLKLWHRFWSKPIVGLTDLRLASAHQEFLEKRGVKL